MSLIRKANELSIQTRIKCLIYGQAGMGKTTLAISMPKPLLFDFDGGVTRVNYAHLENVDTVQIQSYNDFIEVLKEDLSAYETLIIDTGGKALDFMAEYIIKNNSKMGKANGTLTLQGYGERKAIFQALCRQISMMDKHLVFVAHRETQKDGDDMRYVPLFGGSNYDSLVTELDLVGYMEANGKKRQITFDPSSRNDGKNTCNLPSQMEIPIIVNEQGQPTAKNDFMLERVVKPYISRLEERKNKGDAYNSIIAELKENIDLITDADSANDFVKRLPNFNHIGSSKAMAVELLTKKRKELGLTQNKDTHLYENAEYASHV